MRLFIAIDLDDEARAAVAREQRRLATAIDRDGKDLTWVAASRMHLTLVFLGEVAETAARPLIAAMAEPFAAPPFDLALAGTGVFPADGTRKPPRVLWLGIKAGADETIAIRRDVAARVAGCGVPLEDHAFHPHLTLARWRRSAWSDRRRVADVASTATTARVRVDHVTLYQSRLSSSGPSYTALARATLFPAER